MFIRQLGAWAVVGVLGLLEIAGIRSAAAQAPLENAQCLGCHGVENFEVPRADGIARSLSVNEDKFKHSLHGKVLQCVNCHQNSAEFPHKNISKDYAEWRQSIPGLCGTCHTAQRDQYLKSVHGKEMMQNANVAAATCSDCHTSHEVQRPATDSVRLSILKSCGTCHDKNYNSYRDTYHGQVSTLGYAHTAKCFDCHGSHDIQRVKDPSSTVHPDNRLQTCRKCHANATAGFVSFQPHATTNNFERYPHTWLASKFMIALLGVTFAFFWAHSLLWLYREYRDREQHKPRAFVRTEGMTQEPYYRRWGAAWRIAHLGFAITVIVLVTTGMTLLYADTAWAPAVQRFLGGPLVTGTVHRTFAVLFVTIFAIHLAYVAFNIVRGWKTFRWFGPYSMIPNLQDLRDMIAMFKWFFGRGPRPQFDRWTYWEKFDYWAPFWGVTIIGTSGFMLWFNNLTATYLPGWVFNVATIFHGEEAFLAAGFLFTVHFFNNHWRPENFPLDILMFTGAMPLEKFKREHAVEYRRLVETGELSQHLVEAPSRPMTLGSKILGFTLMGIGLTLLVLIAIGFIGGMMAER